MFLELELTAFERNHHGNYNRETPSQTMEFHICNEIRSECGVEKDLFSISGNVVFTDFPAVRSLAQKLNTKGYTVKAGQLNAMGLIDEILHYLVSLYREQVQPDVFDTALARLNQKLGESKTLQLLKQFCTRFPPKKVYSGETTVDTYLETSEGAVSHEAMSLEEILLLAIANLNPAFKPFFFMFDDKPLAKKTAYDNAVVELQEHLKSLPLFGQDGLNLWDLLRAPAIAAPDSLSGQLKFMRRKWGLLLKKFLGRILLGQDVIKEEEKIGWVGGPGPAEVITYGSRDVEYEKYSPDQDWMPRTVLIAKSTLVWMYQLSQKYKREIMRLDQIPDEELDELARRGFTGLWLIGLWERSNASKTIKQWTGNPEAAASAYSLYDYDIAAELGGWDSLKNLRERCFRRGIRLGSDMVPNHTGIDSRWVIEHPDRFLQLSYPPFPSYNYTCGNLSGRDDITVQVEDHYFTRSDAAVVFKRTDNRTGEARYIYHGNDGTSMPWNDTAQIDFLNPEAREAVIRTIIGVCQQFPIVRFDAAMTLAKRHIQRLWYPEPGRGGDIASRAEHAISNEEFDRRIPNEFWRELVDRCAAEAPHTLLLAEAFWMMEGYFVRTLGMHRVYNSAFMNMLKKEENAKYRATIKNTLEFDPEVLKRFVNFMNNPDEDTAVAQFGKGDKYFGICTLMVTMPGLPMFGHGQIEGFEEKYGMEYRRAYRGEQPDQWLVDRHEREIFPLMKKRLLFSGSEHFRLFDLYKQDGWVDENVFAYSNRAGNEGSLVFYNNSYYGTAGWIRNSAATIPQKDGTYRRDTLFQSLHLDGDFALFHEQRSGLWFIRSVQEINERGFFVALKSYEVQVFLDIHSVQDTDGRWSKICNELNGKGIEDLDAAMQDIFLAELYVPFVSLFDQPLIEAFGQAIAGCSESGAVNAGDNFILTIKSTALAFITTALRYVGGANGRYDAFTTASYYLHENGKSVPEAVWKDFEAYLKRVFQFALMLKQPGEKIARQPAYGIFDQAHSSTAFLLGYGVFSLLRSILGKDAYGADAAALICHWQLDRKLRNAYINLGIPNELAYGVIELMKAVLTRTAPTESLYSADNLPASIITENCGKEDFRRLLGINVFDDVTWYDKEKFDCALMYASLFLSFESDEAFTVRLNRTDVQPTGKTKPVGKAPASKGGRKIAAKTTTVGNTEDVWHVRLKMITDIREKLQQAEEKAAYRLDKLIEALE
ncbi:MAG: alpha-amylase [Treponema sp.]|jgi:glycosidase|nr:alpha-amylase [Treponema sp.]